MEMMTAGFVATVFAAGLISFFSPCVLPLLPVYLGYLSDGAGSNRSRSGLLKAFAFALGIGASFFLLGLGAGALGGLVSSRWFFLACGVMVIFFGLHYTGLLAIPFLDREKKLDMDFNPRRGLGGAFALGFFFSFGWTPCVGPVLGSVLGFSSQQGSALAGGSLLLVYALGLSIPFAVLALGSRHLLARLTGIYPHFRKIRVVGGVLIILMGMWMIMQQVMAPMWNVDSAVDSGPYSMRMDALNAEASSLSDFRGRTVYVKFWATWCPLCLAGLEDFAALSDTYADVPGTAVISVVMPGLNGEVSKEAFTEWANAQQLKFPIYFDEQGALIREFGIRAYPSAVYLDSNGTVVKQTVGDEQNEHIINELSRLGADTAPGGVNQ